MITVTPIILALMLVATAAVAGTVTAAVVMLHSDRRGDAAYSDGWDDAIRIRQATGPPAGAAAAVTGRQPGSSQAWHWPPWFLPARPAARYTGHHRQATSPATARMTSHAYG